MYDVHTHFIPPEAMEWLRANAAKVNAEWRKKDPAKAAFLSVNGQWEFELKETFVNGELYLQERQKAGIRHSLVSPIPQLFLYDFDPAVTLDLSRAYNDGMVAWTKAHEGLSGLATVPLNAPEQAAAELERAMARGLRGAIVASSWGGKLLSDPTLVPFWEAAEAKRAIVFVHPLLCADARLKQKMMPNLIGVPWETTVCATALMLNGYLEKYPNVKILLAHGGGYLPYQIGRIGKGWTSWPAVSASLSMSPQEAARRFWYDTVLWNESALEHLIRTVGEDRVVQGTDFPFDLCEWPPADVGAQGFESLMD